MSLLLDALRKAEKSKSSRLAKGKSEKRRVGRLRLTRASAESSAPGANLAHVGEANEVIGEGVTQGQAVNVPSLKQQHQSDTESSIEVDLEPNPESKQLFPGFGAPDGIDDSPVARSIFDPNNRSHSRRRLRAVVLSAAAVVTVFLLSYYGWLLNAALTPSTVLASRPTAVPVGMSAPRAQGTAAGVAASYVPTAEPDVAIPSSGTQSTANLEFAQDSPGEWVDSDSAAKTRARRTQLSVQPGTALRAQVEDNRTPFVEAMAQPDTPEVRAGGAKSSDIAFSRGRPRSSVFPRLAQAYAAYRVGDYAKAELHYRFVLSLEPNNRDALLGTAALAVVRGQVDKAWTLYKRILEVNPRDRAALASLMTMQEDIDPVEAERLLRQLLEEAPDAAYLHAALGNLYAADERWPLAQKAYFEAYHHETQNGDYAHNLAVALDHMGQGQAALRYYLIALEMAGSEAVAFETEAVHRRVQMLVGGSRPRSP